MARGGNVVVLGGSGQLGAALVRLLARRGRAHAAPPRHELDLSSAARLEAAMAALSPVAVLNAAAFTDVARAEFPECRVEVDRLNRDAPEQIAAICARLGIPLAHVSTDYVFDGAKQEPYDEEDPVRPLQVYGRSKLEGEQAVRNAYPGALVVRTSTLYGPGPRIRPHYVDAVLGQARERSVLEVVRKPVSSPTYAPDLAAALLELLDVGAQGLVHVVNGGGCSRLELAREAVRLAGLAERVLVRERPEPAGSLARPSYSVLDTARFGRLVGRPMRAWDAALREYVEGRPA